MQSWVSTSGESIGIGIGRAARASEGAACHLTNMYTRVQKDGNEGYSIRTVHSERVTELSRGNYFLRFPKQLLMWETIRATEGPNGATRNGCTFVLFRVDRKRGESPSLQRREYCTDIIQE